MLDLGMRAQTVTHVFYAMSPPEGNTTALRIRLPVRNSTYMVKYVYYVGLRNGKILLISSNFVETEHFLNIR
jgi:hypothetical protein